MLVKQNKISNFDNRLNFLTKIFKSHLNYLSKNTRKTKKWVLDTVLNQNFITIAKPCFDFFELKKNLNKNLLIKSTAPKFFVDYIWFKNMNIKKHNDNIFKQLFNQQLNFIDFETRFLFDKLILSSNINKINQIISRIDYDTRINLKDLNKIQQEIKIISKKLNTIVHNNKVSLALNELIKIIIKLKKIKKYH